MVARHRGGTAAAQRGVSSRLTTSGPKVPWDHAGPYRYSRPGVGTFDVLIDGLVHLGCQAVTFDPPGSGHSTRPARLALDEMLGCADEALAAWTGGTPVDAIGHSMAGRVLLAYTLERPGRVRRLILVGTGTGDPRT